MTEIDIHRASAAPAEFDHAASGDALVRWAMAADRAHRIAQQLAATAFVPASMRGKPDDVTAAILAGQELGLQPMAALRSMDIIQGTPALRAHAMRGLVQAHGHQVQVVESTAERCVMTGRRKGEPEWQQVEWTLDRARQLGLTSKDQWKKQPTAMLIARATGEICRLIASDVLHAMPYASEEIDGRDRQAPPSPPPAPRVTISELTAEPDPEPETEEGQTAPEPAAQAEPPTAPRDGVTEPQLKAIGARMRELGITDRADALACVTEIIGRRVESRNELTREEAKAVIEALDAPTAEEVAFAAGAE